jgi:hypothetical protein
VNRLGLTVIAVTCIPFWALVGCGVSGHLPQITRPPVQYQGDAVTVIRFRADAQAECDGAVMCFRANGIVAPNPCRFAESYAIGLCHEQAHKNGWPGSHPRP